MSATPIYGWFGLGQSNYWGKGSTTYAVASRCFRLAPSGLLYALGPGNMLLNNFANDPLGIPNREATTYSLEGALADALAPIPGVHVMVNCASNGSGSDEWASADLTTSPITLTSVSLIEAAKVRMLDFLSRPNTIIGGCVIYQGESNTTGNPAATPADWITDWDAICDELVSFVGASRFASSKRFAVVQLPPTYPSGMTAFGGNAPDWASVRTNQATLVSTTRSADADCILISSVDPVATVAGENYHLETAALQVLGEDVGEGIVANWGLT